MSTCQAFTDRADVNIVPEHFKLALRLSFEVFHARVPRFLAGCRVPVLFHSQDGLTGDFSIIPVLCNYLPLTKKQNPSTADRHTPPNDGPGFPP